MQDAGEGEEEEEEEEEEEDDAVGATPMKGQKSGKQVASDPLTRTPDPVRSVRTSPTTSEGPRSLDDKPLIDLSVYTLPSFGEGKVRTVRQWAPRTDWAGTAQV